MKKHEHPTNRLEKMSNFFGGGNFSKLNLYNKRFRFYKWLAVNLLLLGCGASQANDPMTLQAARSNGAFVASWEVPGGWSLRLKMASPEKEQFDGRASIRIKEAIQSGINYRISFNLKADRPMLVNADFKAASPPWTFVGGSPGASGENGLKVDTSEKPYSFSVKAVYNYPEGGTNVNLYFGANPPGSTLTITDFKLEKERPAVPLDLKKCVNFGFRDETPGDGKGGWSDQGEECDFKSFPVDKHDFAGIPFQIIDPAKNGERSVLSFHSNTVSTGLKSAEIILPEKRRYLYLLHTASYAAAEKLGAVVGHLRFDGVVAQVPVPIKNYCDVADWCHPQDLENGIVGYAGKASNGNSAAVFVSKFEIPIGTDKVVLQAEPGDANWIVLAATLSDSNVFQIRKEQEVVANSEWRPIVVPIYVTPGSSLDFTGNRKPAGTDGRVIAREDGLLACVGTPERTLRLYGFNFIPHRLFGYPVFWNKLPEAERKRAIDRFADGVAAAGYNALRWHFLDYALIYQTKRGNSLEPLPVKPEDVPLDPLMTDIFCYLFQALKERGIYAVIDLTSSSAGWTDCYPWDEKNPQIGNCAYRNGLYYNDRLRQNWKAGAERLLNLVNPYTKLALKDDPAVVGVTFVNEQYFSWSEKDCNAMNPEWQKWMRRRTGENREFPALNKQLALGTDPVGVAMALFMGEKECEMISYFTKVVRDTGFKGLVSNDICFSIANVPAMFQMQTIAWHPYFAHPNYVNGKQIVSGDSALVAASISAYRFFDKPLFINEYNHVMWNQFRHEGTIRYATLAALQNWSAFFPHSDAVFPMEEPMSPFAISQDPVWRGQMTIAYFAFSRGDLKSNPRRVGIEITKKDMETKGATGISYSTGALGWLTQYGMCYNDDAEAKANSVDLRLGPSGEYRQRDKAVEDDKLLNMSQIVQQLRRLRILPAKNRTDTRKGIYQSGSGEVLLDTDKNEITVVSPQLEMCVVKTDHPMPMGAATLKSAGIPVGLAVVSLDENSPLAKAGRILLVVTTDALNSGQTFTSDKRLEQVDKGRLPVLLRCGKFEFTLNNPMSSPKLYALNMAGDRIESIPVAAKDGQLHFTIDTTKLKEPAVFFELTGE